MIVLRAVVEDVAPLLGTQRGYDDYPFFTNMGQYELSDAQILDLYRGRGHYIREHELVCF